MVSVPPGLGNRHLVTPPPPSSWRGVGRDMGGGGYVRKELSSRRKFKCFKIRGASLRWVVIKVLQLTFVSTQDQTVVLSH